MKWILLSALLLSESPSQAGTVFLEAESFATSGGWSVIEGPGAKTASGLKMLGGASGQKDGVATMKASIKDAGHYRVWVRYSSHPSWRGPFHVSLVSGGRVLADALFDATFEGKSARDTQVWKFFEADLPEGELTLRLSKHENQNSAGPSRQIDCLLLTMDAELVPNHLAYGAQTFVRVKLGDGYTRPAYIHIFADHFHAPWYQHYSLGRSGSVQAVVPKKQDLLQSGESTPWCNLTPMIYQDSGAMLHITARHGYTDYAERLRATFEFATAPDENAVVRRMEIDNQPGTVAIYLPPDLLAAENLALLKTDREIAEATGAMADAHVWPGHGKRPAKFPFFVSESIDDKFTPADAATRERERKTLDYFGFTDNHLRHIGGAWLMKNKSYCDPDIDKMREKFTTAAEEFRKEGGRVKDIVFCELTDEPTGQPLEVAAKDPAYVEPFRAWLKKQGKTPQDLRVASWDDVKIVTADQREALPALYYFSQLFRTRALGDFMATQRRLAEQAYGGSFPVLANFSDGAVYGANFCLQGVDYFELLDSADQNAIWGEDWSNGASSYQCASFNVDLMRGAARERGQVIAHHLVAHANRTAWDIKLKATSEAARGVKIFNNFCYGPVWATHEGGPYWRSHVWQGRPETWTANAAITREIGAVEDLLITAMPAPAEVALIYSTASDAWTLDETSAHGFERMHTWMALAHAQTPVDIVAERQIERGMLQSYKVCYLHGPNLTRAAAAKLRQWVLDGGTLWLGPGAASRDEFNRPMNILDDILPAMRGELVPLQAFRSSGRYLNTLSAKDTAHWSAGSASVVAVKQSLTPGKRCEVEATFDDDSPALAWGRSGRGGVYCCGFLPALAYIKTALDHRAALQKKVDDKKELNAQETREAALLERSYNPWRFPAEVRELMLAPVRTARILPPITCDVPLVDAVFMRQDKGVVIPLANYTLVPIADLHLRVRVSEIVARAESAVRGRIDFKTLPGGDVDLSLPLDNNDFVALWFE